MGCEYIILKVIKDIALPFFRRDAAEDVEASPDISGPAVFIGLCCAYMYPRVGKYYIAALQVFRGGTQNFATA